MSKNEPDIPNDAQQARDMVADLNDLIARLANAGVRVEVTVSEVNTFGQHPRPSVALELWRRVAPNRMGDGRVGPPTFDFTGFEPPEGWPEPPESKS